MINKRKDSMFDALGFWMNMWCPPLLWSCGTDALGLLFPLPLIFSVSGIRVIWFDLAEEQELDLMLGHFIRCGRLTLVETPFIIEETYMLNTLKFWM